MLWPDGRSETVEIGPDLERGMRPQLVAPRGVWQGCHLREGGRFALLSCTVAPGFDYSDYESGAREELIGQYPDRRQLIEKLTPA
jgi:predicted cupin superfamily sugar epimerase